MSHSTVTITPEPKKKKKDDEVVITPMPEDESAKNDSDIVECIADVLKKQYGPNFMELLQIRRNYAFENLREVLQPRQKHIRFVINNEEGKVEVFAGKTGASVSYGDMEAVIDALAIQASMPQHKNAYVLDFYDKKGGKPGPLTEVQTANVLSITEKLIERREKNIKDLKAKDPASPDIKKLEKQRDVLLQTYRKYGGKKEFDNKPVTDKDSVKITPHSPAASVTISPTVK